MNELFAIPNTEKPMQNITVTIINQLGLHTRAAAKLVSLAARFQSQIEMIRKDNGKKANCKSIMGIMLLGVTCGTPVDLLITGDDEVEARDAIVELIDNRFGEAE